MKSIPCGLLVAVFIQVALAAPSSNRTMSDTVMVGQTVSVGDLDQFVVVFGVSPCMSSCLDHMRSGFNSSDSAESDEDRRVKFQEVCDNYLEAAECFKKCPDGDDHLFEVISSGFNFMCVEQRAAFERAMPCIRENKKAMKEECGKKCHLPDDDSDDEDDSSEDIPPKWNNSSALFDHVGGLCETLRCSIECGRDLLNERCDKDQHVGNLLTEVIIRPLEKNAELLKEMSPEIDQAISRAIPKSCHFIVDIKELNALRAGWVAPFVEGNHLNTQEPKFFTRFPFSTTIKQNMEQNLHRRRRSASNILSASGVSASNAFSYFV